LLPEWFCGARLRASLPLGILGDMIGRASGVFSALRRRLLINGDAVGAVASVRIAHSPSIHAQDYSKESHPLPEAAR